MKSQHTAVGTMFCDDVPLLAIDPYKVYQSIIDVVVAIDGQGYFRFVSASAATLFGYSDSEMMGKSFLDFIHPDDIEKTKQVVAARTHDCRTSNVTNRYIKKDGSVLPIIWSGRWDENDKMLYCVARDGSEQYEIEERLNKAQQLAGVASFEFDLQTNEYANLSNTFFEIFGLDSRQHTSFTPDLFWRMVHPDDVEEVRNNLLMPAFLDHSVMEYRIIKPGGAIAYIRRTREVVRDGSGRHIKTIGTVQDISASKIAEIALQQREERFRSLVQNGNDILGIIDKEGNYLFAGANVKTHLGYDADDLIGQNAFGYIHPDDLEAVLNGLQKVFDTTSTIMLQPFRFQNKSKEWRWMEVAVTNHLSNPAIEGLITNSRDITEKKGKDDEMQRLSLIATETNNTVIIQDNNRRVVWVNHAFTYLTGYTLEECIGKHISEICDGPDTDIKTIKFVEDQIRNRKPFRIETINYKKNNDTYWTEISCQPIFDEKGELIQFFSIGTDISERRQFEEQREKEQHEQQVKISAATLKAQEYERTVVSQELHDNVNQVLTTVKLYTEMCLEGYGDTKEIMNKSIKLLQESIDEIRSLSKRLSAPSLGKIKLAESIRELVEAVGATNKFEIVLDVSEIELLEADADIHLALYRILQEHLTNILRHAQASCVQVTTRFISGHIALEIKDDGRGFDPDKKRNGIGITNMITRAESLGGNINFISAPGEGCVLMAAIPLS